MKELTRLEIEEITGFYFTHHDSIDSSGTGRFIHTAKDLTTVIEYLKFLKTA